jgi:hypothetical protein
MIVVPGTPLVVARRNTTGPYLAAPFSVAITPGSGNTSKCEFTLTPGAVAMIAAGNGASVNWQPWSLGTVAVPSSSTFNSPCDALRFTVVSGTSNDVVEISG